MTGGGSLVGRDGDGKLLIVQTAGHIRDREVEAVSNWMTTGLKCGQIPIEVKKNGMNELRCQVK